MTFSLPPPRTKTLPKNLYHGTNSSPTVAKTQTPSVIFGILDFLIFFSIGHPSARLHIPEFDNRIWLPFVERAHTFDRQICKWLPFRAVSEGCTERDATGRVTTDGNPWSCTIGRVGNGRGPPQTPERLEQREPNVCVLACFPLRAMFALAEGKRWESSNTYTDFPFALRRDLTRSNDGDTCCGGFHEYQKEDS